MATGKNRAVGRQLRTLFDVGAIRELTDGQLLERFATNRGEGSELAFAALVERHGAMVLRVARGVLDDPHDAEDAFQATFLVLVARAGGLWVRDSLGPWLHQVAYRTATCLRSNVARRKRLERRAALVDEAAPPPKPVDDLARILLEEIDRLPERYRAPVVLCDLEGRTHEQAARALGWPIGTVKSRQARARDRLRDRLTRRGVAPGLAPLAAWPAIDPTIPAFLIDSVTVAAVRFVATRAIVPGTAAALAREVIRSMIILRWTKAVAVLLGVGAATTSGAGLIGQDPGDKPGEAPKPKVEAKAPAAPVDDPSVVEVKPGKLRQVITEKGNLEASSTRDVICEVEGGTTIIMIKPEGVNVKKGDVVAELDSAALKDKLISQKITTQQAEASYKQAKLVREVAESAFKEYFEGQYGMEKANLKRKADHLEDAVAEAKLRLERTRAARKRLDEAVARRAGPETPADIVAELTLADRLAAAELEIKAREVELEATLGQGRVLIDHTYERRIKGLKGDVAQAMADELRKESEWHFEQSKAKKLERQIERCSLKAPIDGILVYANDPGGPNRPRTLIEEGGPVRERQMIARVVDLSGPMRLNTKVHESIIDQLAVGNPVKIVVDAYPNQVFTGEVQVIPPMADPTSFYGNVAKSYSTRVSIKADPAKFNFRPGMSARAEILVGERDNVLQVPHSSVFARGDNWDHCYVAVKPPGGVPEWREVDLGAESFQQTIEVKSGLKPGDRVVLQPNAFMGLDMTGKRPAYAKNDANPF